MQKNSSCEGSVLESRFELLEKATDIVSMVLILCINLTSLRDAHIDGKTLFLGVSEHLSGRD